MDKLSLEDSISLFQEQAAQIEVMIGRASPKESEKSLKPKQSYWIQPYNEIRIVIKKDRLRIQGMS